MKKLFKTLAAMAVAFGAIAIVSCSSPAPTPAPAVDTGMTTGGGYVSSK